MDAHGFAAHGYAPSDSDSDSHRDPRSQCANGDADGHRCAGGADVHADCDRHTVTYAHGRRYAGRRANDAGDRDAVAITLSDVNPWTGRQCQGQSHAAATDLGRGRGSLLSADSGRRDFSGAGRGLRGFQIRGAMTTTASSTGRAEPLTTLLAQLPARLLVADVDPVFSSASVRRVTDDSRAVGADTLFVAVPGMSQDGHRYIPQAIAAGALAVVGSHPLDSLKERSWWPGTTDVPFVQVTDSREALACLSAAFFGFPSREQTVIGVTGTDGKTTTCSILEAVLSQAADVGVITTVGARIAGVEQETGLHVTTPEAPQVQAFLAQMREAGCGYAILESTSFGLDQKRVAAVDYDVAAVTNITHEHLDIHGSYEAYRAAKTLLFRSLFRSKPKPGVARIAVLNRDDSSYQPVQAALAEEWERNGAAVVTPYSYSVSDAAADLYARRIEYLPYATRFELVWRGGRVAVGDPPARRVQCVEYPVRRRRRLGAGHPA